MKKNKKEIYLLETFKEFIKVAESVGMVFTGDFDDEGLPLFIGTMSDWNKFEAVWNGEQMAKDLNIK